MKEFKSGYRWPDRVWNALFPPKPAIPLTPTPKDSFYYLELLALIQYWKDRLAEADGNAPHYWKHHVEETIAYLTATAMAIENAKPVIARNPEP